MMLFVSVTLSFLLARGSLYPVVRTAPYRVQVLKSLDPPQRVDRRFEDVVRIVGTECLREDVLDTGCLEDRSYGAARDEDRKSTRLNSSHSRASRMPSSA